MVMLTNENSKTSQAHSLSLFFILFLFFFLGLLLIHPQFITAINTFFSKASYLRYFITSSAVKKKKRNS